MDFKAGIYNADGSGIVGSIYLKLKIKRDVDDMFYDFSDGTFKSSGHTTIAATMTDVDTAKVPGEYEYSLDVSSWDDGVYTCYFQYNGSPAFTDAWEFRVYEGKESVASISDINTDVLNEVRNTIASMTVDGTIDVKECLKILLAVLAGDMSKTLNTYTYKDQSGAAKLTEVVSTDAVVRTIE